MVRQSMIGHLIVQNLHVYPATLCMWPLLVCSRSQLAVLPKSMLLFESICVLWVLLYPASRPNHTSYRKFYFYEFVANVLRDNMGRFIFYLRGCGGYLRPKHHLSDAHFGTLTQCLVYPTAPVLLTKDSIRNEISYDFQPPFSLHILNSRTKPTGLDF